MDYPRSSMEVKDTIEVSPQDFVPVVTKYIKRFTSVQWNLLAAGIEDADTTATIANLCADIVQLVVTMVLRIVRPLIEKGFQQEMSLDDIKESLGGIDKNLGHSLSASFAIALDVPMDECESAEELSELIEREVSHKVSSIASEALSCSDWPLQPAVFVSGSNIKFLYQMVFKARKCLQKCLLKCQCLGSCWHPGLSDEASPCKSHSKSKSKSPEKSTEMETFPERAETPSSVQSRISVHTTTSAVTDILLKWSNETADSGEKGDKISPSATQAVEAKIVAYDIVKAIREDLHYDNFDNIGCCEKSKSPQPHFDMRPIVDMVKDFFDKPASATANVNPQNQKSGFVTFAKNQYRKMMTELKTQAKRPHSRYLVRLRQKARKSPGLVVEDDQKLYIGEIPESPSSTPRPFSRTSVFSTSKTEVNFEAIEPQIEELFDKLKYGNLGARASTSQENIMLNDNIKKLLKELIGIIYDNLMEDDFYQIPVVSVDGHLTNRVIPAITRREDGATSLSPEVRYAMAEDMVGKLLQNLILCVDKERSEKTAQQLSGTLTDILELIDNKMSSSEEDGMTPTPEPPETCDVPTTGSPTIRSTTRSPATRSFTRSPSTQSSGPRSPSTQSPGPRSPATESPTAPSPAPRSPATQSPTAALPPAFPSNLILCVDKEQSEKSAQQLSGTLTDNLELIDNKMSSSEEDGMTPTPEPPETCDVPTTGSPTIRSTTRSPATRSLTRSPLTQSPGPRSPLTVPQSLATQSPATQSATQSPTAALSPAFPFESGCSIGKVAAALNAGYHCHFPSWYSPPAKRTTPLFQPNRKVFRSTPVQIFKESGTRQPGLADTASPRSQDMTNEDRPALPTTRPNFLQRLLPNCIRSHISEDMTTETTTLLYLRLITHIRARTGDSSQIEDINTIIQQLSDMLRDSSSKKIKKNLKRLNNEVLRDLCREFGSVDQVLEVLLASDDTSFDDTLVRYLKFRLNTLHNAPKRSKLSRFFSALARVF